MVPRRNTGRQREGWAAGGTVASCLEHDFVAVIVNCTRITLKARNLETCDVAAHEDCGRRRAGSALIGGPLISRYPVKGVRTPAVLYPLRDRSCRGRAVGKEEVDILEGFAGSTDRASLSSLVILSSTADASL